MRKLDDELTTLEALILQRMLLTVDTMELEELAKDVQLDLFQQGFGADQVPRRARRNLRRAWKELGARFVWGTLDVMALEEDDAR